MVYKAIRWILLLAVLVSLVFALGLAMGWVGLQKTAVVLQLFIVTTGLYIFYETRAQKIKTSWLKMPALLAHVLVLPCAVLLAIAVSNENFAQHYWFLLNLILVICLGITWLVLLLHLPLPRLAKMSLTLVSFVYLVLLCLHMAGSFANGKVIFFLGLLLFPISIALVLLGIKKPVVKEQPPVAE